jgi:hypothetical protein
VVSIILVIFHETINFQFTKLILKLFWTHHKSYISVNNTFTSFFILQSQLNCMETKISYSLQTFSKEWKPVQNLLSVTEFVHLCCMSYELFVNSYFGPSTWYSSLKNAAIIEAERSMTFSNYHFVWPSYLRC